MNGVNIMGFIWFDNGLRVTKVPAVARRRKITQKEPGYKEKDFKESKSSGRPHSYSKTPYTRSRTRMRASQIMSSPVETLGPDSLLEEAWELIGINRFRHVPVVDHDGRVVGIVSDRDLLKYASEIRSDDEAILDMKNSHLKDVITPYVLTATPETEIREIARIMIDERIGSMPVVDSDLKLVGIITRSDILKIIVNIVPFESWV